MGRITGEWDCPSLFSRPWFVDAHVWLRRENRNVEDLLDMGCKDKYTEFKDVL